ncbi:LuxR C-terminal-related transcriptional regulator [Propionicimonas paludicola]|uniref:LuxR C-terminal-related transcriptional regulator n=1 Tax=Propionicimonas paludicola TaxID=185243 RepID=UPI001472C698|nr:LuxR C-terminal-related transcriptional regulator [Propionicimonas paludicola]
MTTTLPRRAWPILDRPSEIAAIRDSLAGDRLGVVVTGEVGVGKTTTALAAARAAHNRYVHIHGSETARQVPYSALVPWLSPFAPASGLGDVSAVADALSQALAVMEGSGRPVIVIDPAPLVDDLSAHALTQVAKTGLAHLVIVARTLPDLPEPFLEMWRDGLLGEHRVEPWQLGEVVELLTRHLGAPVALWSAQELARVAGYQPLFLRYLVDDQLAAGTFALHDGTWVLSKPAGLGSTQIATVMRARLDERSAEERRVLELVALAGELPYAVLEQLADPEALESLLDTELLEVESAAPARARLRHRAIADLVRGSVPFARRRRLRAEVLAGLGAALPQSGTALLSFAVWTLDCGEELPPEVALEAARQANRFSDPNLALRMAELVVDPALRLPAQIESSVALRMLGKAESATAALSPVVGPELANLDGSLLSALAEECVLVAVIDPQAVPIASAALRLAHAAPGVNHRRLTGLGFELLAAQGRYQEMLPELEACCGPHQASEEWLLLAGSLLEALSLTGRQQDALTLAGEVAATIGSFEVTRTTFDVVHAALFGVFMKCGLLSQSRQTLLDGAVGLEGRMLLIGAATDSAIGMTYVLGGYSDQARHHLGQALSQSRVSDARRSRPQIAAGLAYAAALQGDQAAARAALAEWAAGPRTYWNISASGDYLATAARVLLDGLDNTAADLFALADDHHRLGMVIDELFVLSAAARAGSTEAVERILSLQIAQPGPLAAAILAWAHGVRDSKPAPLIEAAQQMLTLGNPLFAREAASLAVALGGSTLVRARTVAQQAAAMMTHQPHNSPLDGLTPREREVSYRAARGDSNKAIAAELYLSVRTVESYLQSAFTKLGIRGRAELSTLLEQP